MWADRGRRYDHRGHSHASVIGGSRKGKVPPGMRPPRGLWARGQHAGGEEGWGTPGKRGSERGLGVQVMPLRAGQGVSGPRAPKGSSDREAPSYQWRADAGVVLRGMRSRQALNG